MSPPRTKAILFVAHPDDETLFFYTYILNHKPYVVLMFTGWSLKRLWAFCRAMRKYGVKYRAYPMIGRGAYNDSIRRRKIERQIHDCLSIKQFSICASHNVSGEYGHIEHRLVHESVMKVIAARIPVYCPAEASSINQFPIAEEITEAKKNIFINYYRSECWVFDQLKIWLRNEKLLLQHETKL